MKQDTRISKANRSILRDKEILALFGQIDLKEALKIVVARTIEISDHIKPTSNKLIKWLDPNTIDELLTTELKEAGKKPTETLKKKLWLMVLEKLSAVIGETILYQD